MLQTRLLYFVTYQNVTYHNIIMLHCDNIKDYRLLYFVTYHNIIMLQTRLLYFVTYQNVITSGVV